MAITTEKKAVVYVTTWFKIGQLTNVSPYFFGANQCAMTKVNFRKLTFYTCFVKEGHLHRCVFQCIFVPPRCESNKNVRCNMWGTPRVVPQKLQVREQGVHDKQKMVQFHDSSKTSDSLCIAIVHISYIRSIWKLFGFCYFEGFLEMKRFHNLPSSRSFLANRFSIRLAFRFQRRWDRKCRSLFSLSRCWSWITCEGCGYRIVILEDFLLMLQPCVMI